MTTVPWRDLRSLNASHQGAAFKQTRLALSSVGGGHMYYLYSPLLFHIWYTFVQTLRVAVTGNYQCS